MIDGAVFIAPTLKRMNRDAICTMTDRLKCLLVRTGTNILSAVTNAWGESDDSQRDS